MLRFARCSELKLLDSREGDREREHAIIQQCVSSGILFFYRFISVSVESH